MKRKKVSQERKRNPIAPIDLSAIHHKNWSESKVFSAYGFAYCFYSLWTCVEEGFYRFRVCYENKKWREKVNKSFYIYVVDFEPLPFPPFSCSFSIQQA